jgi:hypothetical protein
VPAQNCPLSRMQQLASEASAFDKADAEGRQLTPEEREEAEEAIDGAP